MRKTARSLLVQNTFFEFGAGLFGPIYAIFVEKVGGNILDAGIAWAIFLLSMGLFEILVSKFIDRFESKRVLIAASALYAAVIFSYIFVSNVRQLFVLQFIAGIIIAVDNPAWSSWYAMLQEDGKRGHDFALMYMSNNFAQGFAILIGAALAQFFGFKVIFVLGAAFIMLGVLFIVNSETDLPRGG